MVSAIVPVHNGAGFLAEALESILAQSHSPIEVIVVDDGSTDGTEATLRDYAGSLRVLRQEQRGAASARNRAIGIAQGDFLAFLDADDRWEPRKTERQLALLSREADVEAVFGRARQFRSDGNPATRGSRPDLTVPADLEGLVLGALLIRKEAFLRVGPLDESFQVGEFIEWFSRAKSRQLRWTMLDEVVLQRRIHGANQGIVKRELYASEYSRALRMHLRRLASGSEGD
ncbi:MAG: glycosyltransferase family A protein [Acidobacteriota bacterium]